MELWNSIAASVLSVLSIPLGQVGSNLATVPVGAAAAVLVVALVLAAASPRFLAVAGTVLPIVAILVILTSPASSSAIIAIGSYFACIVIALVGYQVWHNTRTIKADLAALQGELEQIAHADSRRRMMELTSVRNGPQLSPDLEPATESVR